MVGIGGVIVWTKCTVEDCDVEATEVCWVEVEVVVVSVVFEFAFELVTVEGDEATILFEERFGVDDGRGLGVVLGSPTLNMGSRVVRSCSCGGWVP